MKPATLAVALLGGLLCASPLARADEHGEHGEHHDRDDHRGAQFHGDQRGEPRAGYGHEGERRVYTPRPAPPQFRAHPPGMQPRGRVVPPHQVRVLRPEMYHRGEHHWRHWEHPELARPVYYWNWAAVHGVTCVAEDSYGDQYPITGNVFPGFGLANMSEVEDEALDRCYSESGGDQSCYLATCSHY